MATTTISFSWGAEATNIGSALNSGDSDKYFSLPISTINTALNSLPTDAKITDITLITRFIADPKYGGSYKCAVGYGGSGSITQELNRVSDGSTDYWDSTISCNLNAIISGRQLNTNLGSYITYNIWTDGGYGKKSYYVGSNAGTNPSLSVTYETPKAYKLVFDANGGSSIYDGQILEEEYETAITLGSYGFTAPKVKFSYEGDGAALSTSSVEYHRTFLGWEDLGRIVDPAGTVQTADTFDAPYYANVHPDLYAAFGYDKYALVSHYCNHGKGEGRPCINTEGDKTRGVYPEGATVIHLTNIAGETVTLRCQWGAVSGNLLPAPTKEGCEFLGWSDGTTTFAAGTTVTSKVDKTFTAQWKKLTSTLTVKSNADAYGTVTGGGTYENGATATLTATPKTGYKFVKWNDGYTSATRTFTVLADATYIAIFEGITYYVAFDGNYAESGSVATITAKYGQNFTLPENGFVKKAHAIWKPNADDATLSYRASSHAFEFNGWKFSLNSSEIWPPGEKIANMSTTDGATVTCYADWSDTQFEHPIATRPGYKFKEWNTKADGSGTPYTDETFWTSGDVADRAYETILYAQWEKAEPVFTSITITRSTDLAQVTINTPVEAGAKYIISVEVT